MHCNIAKHCFKKLESKATKQVNKKLKNYERHCNWLIWQNCSQSQKTHAVTDETLNKILACMLAKKKMNA